MLDQLLPAWEKVESMKETLYRIWLTLLIIVILLIAVSEVLGQPSEGAMGTFPLPRIVGMTKSPTQTPPPITIDVYPKFALANPYKRVVFRVRLRIERDDRNKRYSFVGECGSDAHARQSQLNGDSPITYTFLQELTVVSDCYFQTCVYRIEKGKVRSYCNSQDVKVQPP